MDLKHIPCHGGHDPTKLRRWNYPGTREATKQVTASGEHGVCTLEEWFGSKLPSVVEPRVPGTYFTPNSTAMSSGGGTASFVFIRSIADAGFATISMELDELAGMLLDRACTKFKHWRLNALQMRLFLVAKAGPKPQLLAPEAFIKLVPLAVEATLESAGVTSGAWLVAVPTTPSGVSARGGVGVACSSDSPRSLKSLESAHGKSREAEASVEFWKLAHAAFPSAALKRTERVLLGGERLISSREFKAADFSESLVYCCHIE
jgi:hypothetical protein